MNHSKSNLLISVKPVPVHIFLLINYILYVVRYINYKSAKITY